ncbi:MAG: hypothetical protein MRY83_19625, partial [Flavobacteriales bacterium]|nr:hypothetical protein [Flavobacteriales bacterium]
AFGFIRNVDGTLHAHSDLLGSHSICYYLDSEKFIISNSQFAINAILEEYVRNDVNIAWMLASGTLKPKTSWDKRIAFIPPDTHLRFDTKNWQLSSEKKSSRKKVKSNGSFDFQIELENILTQLDFNSRTSIGLSGGYDSRIFAHFAKDLNINQAVTWGMRSMDVEGSDVDIARQVARKYGLQHHIANIDILEHQESSLNQYILNTEGRVDHYSAYVDQMHSWRGIGEHTDYLVRGEEVFGALDLNTEKEIRRLVGLTFLDDFSKTSAWTNVLDYNEDKWSGIEEYQIQKGEAIPDWRDRLYSSYRIPHLMAPLNFGVSPYVSVVTPLLFPELFLKFLALPTKDRANKKFLKGKVQAMMDIPVAHHNALWPIEQILKNEAVRKAFRSILLRHQDSGIIPRSIIDELIQNCELSAVQKLDTSKLAYLKKKIPPSWRGFIRKNLVAANVPYDRLMLRAVIILVTQELIQKHMNQTKELIAKGISVQ